MRPAGPLPECSKNRSLAAAMLERPSTFSFQQSRAPWTPNANRIGAATLWSVVACKVAQMGDAPRAVVLAPAGRGGQFGVLPVVAVLGLHGLRANGVAFAGPGATSTGVTARRRWGTLPSRRRVSLQRARESFHTGSGRCCPRQQPARCR